MLHIPDIVLICRSKYCYGINKLKWIKNIDICFSLFSIYLKWTLNMKINEIYLDLYVVDNNLEIAILSIFCLNWWRGYLLLRGSHKDRQIFHSLCVFEICIFADHYELCQSSSWESMQSRSYQGYPRSSTDWTKQDTPWIGIRFTL